jgi:uncharacterized protein YggE
MKKEYLSAISWYGPVLLAGILIVVGTLAPRIWHHNSETQFYIEGLGVSQIPLPPDAASLDVAAVASLAESAKDATAKIGDKIDLFAAYLSTLNGVTFSNTPIEISHEVVQVGQKYAKSFTAKQRLRINVTDFKMLQSVIDKAVELGINDIGSVRYSLSESEKYRKEARQKALDLARAHAEEVASQLGVKLGSIVDYSENKIESPESSDLQDIIDAMDGELPVEGPKNLFVSHSVRLSFSQVKGQK